MIYRSNRSMKGQGENFSVVIFYLESNFEFSHAYFSTDARERCCEQTLRTISGKRCQKWNSKSPHEPNKSMLDYLLRLDFTLYFVAVDELSVFMKVFHFLLLKSQQGQPVI